MPFTKKHALLNIKKKKKATTEAIWKILEIVDSLKPKCVLGLHTPVSMNGTFLVLFGEKSESGAPQISQKNKSEPLK